LYEEIDNFGEERVKLAGQTICKYLLAHEDVVISGSSYVKSKLTNNDCILIYGYSSLVIQVIRSAHRQFKSLRVVVVDARPKKSGKKALKELLDIGVDCTYIHINAVSFVMKLVTKVILGSHALLANGYVMSSAGASQIALIAKSFNVPVVVCCETYKFCDKVQTDAFINNELGNAKELLRDLPSSSPLPALWSPNTANSNINVINLIYDVTPPDLITCVVTDMGMLPCTSVPVVLRVKNRDNCNYSQDNNILLAEQTHKFAELSMKA
jgi:translation initiation factor eIF-2B subunit delta